jgi:hypothetical protein
MLEIARATAVPRVVTGKKYPVEISTWKNSLARDGTQTNGVTAMVLVQLSAQVRA